MLWGHFQLWLWPGQQDSRQPWLLRLQWRRIVSVRSWRLCRLQPENQQSHSQILHWEAWMHVLPGGKTGVSWIVLKLPASWISMRARSELILLYIQLLTKDNLICHSKHPDFWGYFLHYKWINLVIISLFSSSQGGCIKRSPFNCQYTNYTHLFQAHRV